MELLETKNDGKIMVYVPREEVRETQRMTQKKGEPDGVYFGKDGNLIARHWLIHPITAGKMFSWVSIVRILPE